MYANIHIFTCIYIYIYIYIFVYIRTNAHTQQYTRPNKQQTEIGIVAVEGARTPCEKHFCESCHVHK